MKIDNQNYEVVKSKFQEIRNEVNSLINDYNHLFVEYPNIINNIGNIKEELPINEELGYAHKVNEYNRLAKEFEEDNICINVDDLGVIRTNRTTHFPVLVDSLRLWAWLRKDNFKVEYSEKITLRLVLEPIIIDVCGAFLEKKFMDLPHNIAEICAIEIEYLTPNDRLKDKIETQLAISYKFEIFDLTSAKLYDFNMNKYTDVDILMGIPDPGKLPKISSLDSFNEGMIMYLRQVNIEEPDIKYLLLYKILEFFAPIALKKNSYEKLRMKLDSKKRNNLDLNYIQSIFDLVRSCDIRAHDSELVKELFNVSYDFVELYPMLPESIKRMLRADAGGIQTFSYTTKKDKLDKARGTLGNIIYNTRNNIVHSKSNYTIRKEECPHKDLEEFNHCLEYIARSTIKWYNRLPNYLKLKS